MHGSPEALGQQDFALPAPFRPVQRTPPWCGNCRHRGTPAFIDLSTAELAFMRGFKRAHAIASAGELLVRQGAPLDCAAVLYSGWVARYRALPSGERQLLSVLLPGDMIGLEAAGSATSWFTLEALTDVSACLFDPAQLERLLGMPSLGRRLLRRLASDKRHGEERFAAVAAGDPRRSLAHLIFDLHHRLRLRGLAPPDSLSVPLTRKQLADAIGVTTVHLHRVLRDLRLDGILSFDRRRIIIVDVDRLRELAAVRRPAEPLPLI